MIQLAGKHDGEITPQTLFSAVESEIAFAQLFLAVAHSAHKTGETALADHAGSVARSAYQVIMALLDEIDPVAQQRVAADLEALRKSLDEF
jgi:hypothetical protein